MTRRLIVMGSGEISPTMVGVHRDALAALGPDATAILLDTPYGFQENADELTAKIQEYFRVSLNQEIGVASFRSSRTATPLERESMISAVRLADYVFSGPGGPTYALGQWSETAIASVLVEKLQRGGVVVFASAAALTLGEHVIPVYEIYKVGQDPFWVPGLSILGSLGLPAVVVPHFDNAEGGTHDTRFCWLGERRFNELRARLPPQLPIVGIDEHTAWIVDFERDVFTVSGRGGVTLVIGDQWEEWPDGSTLPLDRLRTGIASTALAANPPGESSHVPSLTDRAWRAEERFDHALAARDAGQAVSALLSLLDAIESSDGADGAAVAEAQSKARSMIVRLGSAGEQGLADPRDTIGAFVDVILAARDRARSAGRYEEADQLRDQLSELGLEVRDTPDGAEWDL